MSDDMSDDKKPNGKTDDSKARKAKKVEPNPKPPTIAIVLAAHAVFVDGMARLPDARQRDERDAIHEAIGRGHRVLMEAAGYRDVPADVPMPPTGEEKDDNEAHRRQLALGAWLQRVMDRAEAALNTLTGDGVADSYAPQALEMVVESVGGLLATSSLDHEWFTGRLTVWRRAIAHWQDQQPATEEPA